MATFIGASPEQLDRLAQTMIAEAGHLADIDSRVRAQLSVTTWTGGDMERFSWRWSGQLSGLLAAAAQSLQTAAAAVRGQAQQQRVASGATGSGGSGGSGGIDSWATNPPGGPGNGGDRGEAVPLGLIASLGLFNNLYQPVDIFKTLVLDARDNLENWRNWRAIGRAEQVLKNYETLLEWTSGVERARVDAVLREVNDLNDYQLIRQYFHEQEVVSAARANVADAVRGLDGAKDLFVDGVKWAGPFAKATGVLSIVGGIFQAVDPSYDGWRRDVDRGVGIATIAAGGVLLAVTAGVALPAVVVAAAPLVLVGGAVWTAANHWGDITHGASVASHWIADRGADAGHAVASEARDLAGGAAHEAGVVTHKVGDSAKSAWKSAKGLF